MNKFERGDQIRLVEEDEVLKPGTLYTVDRYHPLHEGVLSLCGRSHCFHEKLFELVVSKREELENEEYFRHTLRCIAEDENPHGLIVDEDAQVNTDDTGAWVQAWVHVTDFRETGDDE